MPYPENVVDNKFSYLNCIVLCWVLLILFWSPPNNIFTSIKYTNFAYLLIHGFWSVCDKGWENLIIFEHVTVHRVDSTHSESCHDVLRDKDSRECFLKIFGDMICGHWLSVVLHLPLIACGVITAFEWPVYAPVKWLKLVAAVRREH